MTTLAKRIECALLAYAAGDAAGAPWEGMARRYVEREQIDQLPAREPWLKSGDVTDDTEQTLIVADFITQFGVDDPDPVAFMSMMATGITGAGRATWEAVRRYIETGEVTATRGSSNGAAMRCLPFGWVCPKSDERRAVTTVMSSTTHGKPNALAAACIMSAMANASLGEHQQLSWVLTDAAIEARYLEEETFVNVDPIMRALRGKWQPPDEMTTDGIVTIANVIYVLRRAQFLNLGAAEAIKTAIALGGDTDTVAALVGGIMGAITGDVSDITWLARVDIEHGSLPQIAAALARIREDERNEAAS